MLSQNSDNKLWGLFLDKGPFQKYFLGGLIFGRGLYMDEYLHFENTFLFKQLKIFEIFCSQHAVILIFSFFFKFLINNVLATVNTTLYS